MMCAIKTPGPDHPIAVAPNPKQVRVSVDGIVIAETARALTLGRPPTRRCSTFRARTPTRPACGGRDHRSYCPYKGEAGYFCIVSGEGCGRTRSGGPTRRRMTR